MESSLPFLFVVPFRLLFLHKQTVIDDQDIHFRSHKAPEGVLRSAYDRFAADIKAGVDHETVAGLLLEFADQGMIGGICFLVDRLDARREIKMRYGLNVRPGMVELVEQRKIMKLFRKLLPSVGNNIGNQKHVGRGGVQVEEGGAILDQYAGSKGAEALPLLYLDIQFFLHVAVSCITKDTAVAKVRGPHSIRPWCQPITLPAAM